MGGSARRKVLGESASPLGGKPKTDTSEIVLPSIQNQTVTLQDSSSAPTSKLKQLFGKHRGAILNKGVPAKESKFTSRKMFEVTMAALRAAQDDKHKIPSQDDINKFQVVQKVRRGSWLFLEV